MSQRKSSFTTVYLIILGGAAVIAGILGLYVGLSLRGGQPADLETASAGSRLTDGSVFPNVPVMDEDSTVYTTRGLLARSGGVVMFLESDCRACSVMVEKWQELIDASEFPDIAVFGVMNESLARIKEFHESTRLTYPIYCDTGKVFENEHYVIDFPLQVAVGRSGTILSHTVDARAPVEISALVALMAQ